MNTSPTSTRNTSTTTTTSSTTTSTTPTTTPTATTATALRVGLQCDLRTRPGRRAAVGAQAPSLRCDGQLVVLPRDQAPQHGPGGVGAQAEPQGGRPRPRQGHQVAIDPASRGDPRAYQRVRGTVVGQSQGGDGSRC